MNVLLYQLVHYFFFNRYSKLPHSFWIHNLAIVQKLSATLSRVSREIPLTITLNSSKDLGFKDFNINIVWEVVLDSVDISQGWSFVVGSSILNISQALESLFWTGTVFLLVMVKLKMQTLEAELILCQKNSSKQSNYLLLQKTPYWSTAQMK